MSTHTAWLPEAVWLTSPKVTKFRFLVRQCSVPEEGFRPVPFLRIENGTEDVPAGSEAFLVLTQLESDVAGSRQRPIDSEAAPLVPPTVFCPPGSSGLIPV
jgi:hypothetical protein